MNKPIVALVLVSALSMLQGCGRDKAPTPGATTTGTGSTASTQPTVPPPPGDSTPKPMPSATAGTVTPPANEKTGQASQPSMVGTAAAGSPPYTLNAAPEGNPAPQQGTKAGETKK